MQSTLRKIKFTKQSQHNKNERSKNNIKNNSQFTNSHRYSKIPSVNNRKLKQN